MTADNHNFINPITCSFADFLFCTKNAALGYDDDSVHQLTEQIGGIAHMRQVHGEHIAYVKTPTVVEDCDGIYTTTPNLWLAVKTADCVPVLIAAKGAVAAVHCGWRGLEQGILGKTINTLIEKFDAVPEEMRVIIGPAIAQHNYEVEESFMEHFDPKFFRPSDREGYVKLDLKGVARAQARAAGVLAEDIYVSPLCTFDQTEKFNSCRRAKAANEKFNVQLSLVRLKG